MMNSTQCFKIKPNTKLHEELKKHFSLLPKWKGVYEKVSELLGEDITKLGYSTYELYIDFSELTTKENKALFKKDGTLKMNLKKSKQLLERYKDIIKEAGLSEYQELRSINFRYGVMRFGNQHLESFWTSEDEVYYKADFDLEKKTNGLVLPISEVEYQEKYLEELKRIQE